MPERTQNMGLGRKSCCALTIPEIMLIDLSRFPRFQLMYMCCSIPSGGLSAFGGIITKGFGFSSFQAVLMQVSSL